MPECIAEGNKFFVQTSPKSKQKSNGDVLVGPFSKI